MILISYWQLALYSVGPFLLMTAVTFRYMMRAVKAEHQAKLLELLVEELSNMVFKDKEAGTVIIKKELDK